MNIVFSQQTPGNRLVDVKTQLASKGNPVFPFSSPTINHHLSTRSDGRPADTQYPQPPASTYCPQSTEHNRNIRRDDKDERYYERHDEPTLSSFAFKGTVMDRRFDARKQSRPDLQIVTSFSESQVRHGEVVLNQVPAKRPNPQSNHTLSIVSQKGIHVFPSPLPPKLSGKATSGLKKLMSFKRNNLTTAGSSKADQRSYGKQDKPTMPTSSLMSQGRNTQLTVEPRSKNNIVQTIVPLTTPRTPKIIVTPADDVHGMVARISPTSIYSSVYHNDSISPNSRKRSSSESQRQILPESSDTERPKSQGWWNLVMSPILSRAGTLVNRRERPREIPPVPALHATVGISEAIQTPFTVMSPQTPRRLGLATARTSTWSQWTEVDKTQDDAQIQHFEEAVPTIPTQFLDQGANGQVRSTATRPDKGEGLAVEYFHACAIEQLTGINYFECVNHSCTEHLPKLCSIDEAGNMSANKWSKGEDTHMHEHKRNGFNSIPHGINVEASKHSTIDSHDLDGSTLRTVPLLHQKQYSLSSVPNEVDADELVSPNLRQANTAVFSKARTVNSREPSPAPSSTLKKPAVQHIRLKSSPSMSQLPVTSPGPMSPDGTRTIAPTGALHMGPLQSRPADKTVPLMAPIPQVNHSLVPPHQPLPSLMYHPYGHPLPYQFITPPTNPYATNYYVPPWHAIPLNQPGPNFESGLVHPSTNSGHLDADQTREHNETNSKLDIQLVDDATRKSKSNNKKRGCGMIVCLSQKKKDHHNRCWTVIIATVLIVLIILCILFALLFTKGNGTDPIESQWLNLTGYPPMPTGVSTIARPNLAALQNQCTTPTTMWSCSLPKEEQGSIGSNDPNQPNFRFQIRFRNGTVPANMTRSVDNKSVPDAPADELFAPNPTPPGLQDQVFLGNTTDNITKPFDGEATPFFITFMTTGIVQSSTNATKRRLARQFQGNNSLDASIPPPSIGPDGTAAPATLLPTAPFPISQPIKLYNRGLQDEHYGFYMYFDKSIFLSGITLRGSNSSIATPSADQNGGSTKLAANVRCTWSQTRFVVKMYTNRSFDGSLLLGPSTNNTTSTQGSNMANSATNFNRPGSFPYPTTILLDRHGGDVNKKLAYCYGMDSGNIVNNAKIFVAEFRASGGSLINPSPMLINQGDSFDSTAGGIDGGTGGCGCTWQNWR